MLGKLLKYDLKWVYKVVIVFYALSLFFSIIGRALSYIENSVIFSIITQICFGIAISMMASSLINCIMRLWTRFVKNVYKDESYLTHTIPVEKHTIYAAKVISALLTISTTAIVIVICLFICYYSQENIQFIKSLLEIAASTYNTTVLNLLLLISSVITIQMIFIVILGYVGIILGHKSNKNKMIRTVVISFTLYMLTQIINIALIGILGVFNSNVMNLINTTNMIDIDTIKYLIYGVIGLNVIYILCYYLLGKKSFEKGVNVE